MADQQKKILNKLLVRHFKWRTRSKKKKKLSQSASLTGGLKVFAFSPPVKLTDCKENIKKKAYRSGGLQLKKIIIFLKKAGSQPLEVADCLQLIKKKLV